MGSRVPGRECHYSRYGSDYPLMHVHNDCFDAR